MPSSRRQGVVPVICLLSAAWCVSWTPAAARAGNGSPVRLQRHAMGTMIDIVAYHEPRAEGERAAARAMDEFVRLDGVMSHYRQDSDLARMVRAARGGFARVEPALYDVIEESLRVSRLSGGKFDVTIAPLLKVWKAAEAEGRRPSDEDVAAARRCVGYHMIDLAPPDRVRFRSDCMDLDLGGIGKGYAVDRAAAVLKAAGVRHAFVNAGGSSIAGIGHPPGRDGWPVALGSAVARTTLLLRDGSISTSQQYRTPLALAGGSFGEILDPHTAAPADAPMTVSVTAPRAVVSDALDTALVLLSIDDGRRLLEHFQGVSAMWMSAAGDVKAVYREPGSDPGRR